MQFKLKWNHHHDQWSIKNQGSKKILLCNKTFFYKGSYPKVDVIDEGTQIIIEAEIPGLNKDQVSVELDNGVLRIKGEKQQFIDTPCKKIIHSELKRSSFSRSFNIGDNINQDELSARFDNNVLKISLPKKIPNKIKNEIKKIEIEWI